MKRELEKPSQFPVWNYMPYAQYLGQKTWFKKIMKRKNVSQIYASQNYEFS